jgi:hypothetical protein
MTEPKQTCLCRTGAEGVILCPTHGGWLPAPTLAWARPRPRLNITLEIAALLVFALGLGGVFVLLLYLLLHIATAWVSPWLPS